MKIVISLSENKCLRLEEKQHQLNQLSQLHVVPMNNEIKEVDNVLDKHVEATKYYWELVNANHALLEQQHLETNLDVMQ